MPARHIATVVTSVLTAGCLAVPLSAAAATASTEPVGGSLLASHGLVVQPLPGAPALPRSSQLPASSWLVADLTTGQVLAAKDPHGRFLPASTLKTLTAITLIPQLNPHRMVRPTNVDVGVDGSKVGLVPSLRYPVSKLFQCLLVVSANDAADALAQAYGGNTRTLEAMNAEAEHLQAYDTHAMTPSGLDAPGESSSAYDLALFAQAGLKLPAFRRYVQTIRTTVPAPHHKHFQIYTHNQLLTTYRGDVGIKNGYTVAAMGTYIGAATRNGQTIVVTLMHANPNFWPMARDLLNWGFKARSSVTPVGTLVQPVSAVASSVRTSTLLPTRSVAAVTHNGRRYTDWELAFIAFTIVVTCTTAVRRLRRSRRRQRNRLKLPRAY